MSESGWSQHGLALSAVDFKFVDDFRTWAIGYEAEISQIVVAVADGLTQGSLSGFEDRIKTLNSLARKVATDRLKDESLSLIEVAAETGDVLRYSIVSSEAAFAATAQRAMLELAKRGCLWRSTRNGFEAGQDDYRGYNTKWRTAQQVPFEVQFHTPDSWRAGKATRWAYEKLRLPGVDPEREIGLKRARAKIYSDVPIPRGTENIQSPDEHLARLRSLREHMVNSAAARRRPPGRPPSRRRGLGRGE